MEKLKSAIEIIAIVLAVAYAVMRFVRAFRPFQLNKENLNLEKVESRRWDKVDRTCRILAIILIGLYLLLGWYGI